MIVNLFFEKKHGNMTIEELEKAFDEFSARLSREAMKKSTGYMGKWLDPTIRHAITVKGLHSAHDMRARSNENLADDGRILVNGKWLHYEVKSGSGIVGKLVPTSQPSWNENDILPKKEIVFYCAEPKEIQTFDDLKRLVIALTREEFIDFIKTEGPKRGHELKTVTKAGTDDLHYREINEELPPGEKIRDCICLQSAYNKARAVAIKSGRYKTFGQFLQEIGRN